MIHVGETAWRCAPRGRRSPPALPHRSRACRRSGYRGYALVGLSWRHASSVAKSRRSMHTGAIAAVRMSNVARAAYRPTSSATIATPSSRRASTRCSPPRGARSCAHPAARRHPMPMPGAGSGPCVRRASPSCSSHARRTRTASWPTMSPTTTGHARTGGRPADADPRRPAWGARSSQATRCNPAASYREAA